MYPTHELLFGLEWHLKFAKVCCIFNNNWDAEMHLSIESPTNLFPFSLSHLSFISFDPENKMSYEY